MLGKLLGWGDKNGPCSYNGPDLSCYMCAYRKNDAESIGDEPNFPSLTPRRPQDAHALSTSEHDDANDEGAVEAKRARESKTTAIHHLTEEMRHQFTPETRSKLHHIHLTGESSSSVLEHNGTPHHIDLGSFDDHSDEDAHHLDLSSDGSYEEDLARCQDKLQIAVRKDTMAMQHEATMRVTTTGTTTLKSMHTMASAPSLHGHWASSAATQANLATPLPARTSLATTHTLATVHSLPAVGPANEGAQVDLNYELSGCEERIHNMRKVLGHDGAGLPWRRHHTHLNGSSCPGLEQRTQRSTLESEKEARQKMCKKKVHNYQAVLADKLGKLGEEEPNLEVTEDPARAVCEGVARYHEACSRIGALYAEPGERRDDDPGLTDEERTRLDTWAKDLKGRNNTISTG